MDHRKQLADAQLARAKEHWEKNEPLKAGHILMSRIPVSLQPAWAAQVLHATLQHAPFAEAEAIIEMTKDPSKWAGAHEAFSVIRRMTLEARGGKKCVLLLAELVARVTYNASSPSPNDPFDEDSGFWIPVLLRDTLKHVDDPELAAKAWSLLSEKKFFPI